MRLPRHLATTPAGASGQCAAYTRTGRRCRLPAGPGTAICALHRPGWADRGRNSFLEAAKAQFRFTSILLRAWLARRRQLIRQPSLGAAVPWSGNDRDRYRV
jgi:hypothetical protein